MSTQTKTKFTRGPCRVEETGQWPKTNHFYGIYCDTGTGQIAKIEGMGNEPKANAELFAAAINAATRCAELGCDGQACIEALPELVEATKLWDKFWDKMPKGQLGKIVCDIGILNDAFIKTGQALAKIKGV